MSEAVILSAVRTPIGKLMGALSPMTAPQLGALAIKAAVERAQIDPGEIDEVYMGQAVSAGAGQVPARQASIFAGIPPHVGAVTENKACGSGLRAVMTAAQAIKAGDAELIVGGGMESMSNVPHLVHMRAGVKYGNQTLLDANDTDGLRDPFEHHAMGCAAEYIAEQYEVTREAMDRFALESHRRAVAAQESGAFNAEMIAVEVKHNSKAQSVTLDESPRRDTSLEALAKLKPAFKAGGMVTAGNAPGLSDGGAALVVASRDKAKQLGSRPLARIVGYTYAAVEPKAIFIAPALAIPKLLKKIGWTLRDVDLVELNEAFAAQVLADGFVLMDDGWNWDKVNVNGGAIALGHPLGCSGARVLVTLVHALRARGLTRGVASLCLGGGEAVAMAVEIEN